MTVKRTFDGIEAAFGMLDEADMRAFTGKLGRLEGRSLDEMSKNHFGVVRESGESDSDLRKRVYEMTTGSPTAKAEAIGVKKAMDEAMSALAGDLEKKLQGYKRRDPEKGPDIPLVPDFMDELKKL